MMRVFKSLQRLSRRFRKDESGITLVEITLTLSIIAVAYLGLNSLLEQFSDQVRAQAIADRLNEVAVGVAQYVDANGADIQTAAAGGPIEIQLDDLVTAGAIDPAITTTISGRTEILNGQGQRHRVIARVIGNSLEVVVLTLDNPLNDVITGAVTSLLGGNGAVVSNRAEVCGASGPICIAGNGGSTLIDVNADFPGLPAAVRPQPGTNAAIIFANEGQVIAPYLYRDAIAGRPDANRMNTDIDMAANRVLSSNLQIEGMMIDGAPVWTSQGIYDVRIVASGDTVPKPVCPRIDPANPATQTNPRISAALVSFAHPNGFPISQVILDAQDLGPNWRLTIRVIGQGGVLPLGSDFGRIEATTYCR